MIRVDGDVRRINLPAMEHKQVHALIYDIMNDKQRKDYEEFLETDFSFEVPGVLAGFRRVLGSGGFALILCPDMQSVAQAMAAGVLEEPLYVSPAGPISALDIVYGHQKAILQGQAYMAHKTAFTAETLAKHLLTAGFYQVRVVRDKVFGLHAIAFANAPDENESHRLAAAVLPAPENMVESFVFSAH